MDAFSWPFCSTTQLHGRSRGIFVRILSVDRSLYLSLYTYVIFIACLRGQYRNYCTRPEDAARGPCAIISVLPE